MLAIESDTDIEIHDTIWDWWTNRKKFIFDNWSYNLPYIFDNYFIPYSEWADFDTILNDNSIIFWQNSDFRNCNEIYEAGKTIHTWYQEDYQLLNNGWILTNSWCTF
jgi:hypothetical protein